MTVATQAQLPGENALEIAALVTEEAMAQLDVLIQPAEAPTGLAFEWDTPLPIWSVLTVRLIVQHKRLEWAIADAVNFGRDAYGDLYAQWVQETGLAKRTLTNYARIGQLMEPARRRADVSFSHHAEVVTLPVPDQEKLLDRAEAAGMSRYDLRDAVRERRKELEGTAVDEPPAPLPISAADLTDEAREALTYRLAGVGARHRTGYERAWLDCIVWLEARDCLTRWPED
jgi:hypothetical protein